MAIFLPFCKSEIDDVNHVAFFSKTHQEIVRFYVSVDESLVVQLLDLLDHFSGHHEQVPDLDLLPVEKLEEVLPDVFVDNYCFILGLSKVHDARAEAVLLILQADTVFITECVKFFF